MDDLTDQTNRMLAANVVPIRALRSYIGLANHFAGLLFTWRPFMDELWAALQSTTQQGKCTKDNNCPWAMLLSC